MGEQFTFSAKPKYLNRLYWDFDAADTIRIRGIMENQLYKQKEILVKLVSYASAKDIARVLKDNRIKFCRQEVLIIDLTRNFARIREFLKCKVDIQSFYLDYDGYGIFQVSDIEKARCALQDFTEDRSYDRPVFAASRDCYDEVRALGGTSARNFGRTTFDVPVQAFSRVSFGGHRH